MPKIIKKTQQKFKNCDTLKIFKYENSKNYYCSFYVGRGYSKSGNKEQSLKTQNVKDATAKAKELWRTFDKSKYEAVDIKEYNFTKDIALPFFKSRQKRYEMKGKPEYAQKELNKYHNIIKPIFETIDFRDAVAMDNAIEDLEYSLKGKIKDVTIAKYFNLMSLMLQKAFKSRVINHMPDLPTLSRITEDRPSYRPAEIKMICNALIRETEKRNDPFYEEVADYVNFCRSAGTRPGLEPLRIKRFQYRFINDEENPNEPILSMNLATTKTGKKHTLTFHPEFTKNIFIERMLKRYEATTAEDYIFFPHEKNRDKLYERIRKNFVRISIELGLYNFNGTTRPLYSVRHTNINARLNNDVDISLVAEGFNTSVGVIHKHYQKHSDQNIVKQHKKLFREQYKKVSSQND